MGEGITANVIDRAASGKYSRLSVKRGVGVGTGTGAGAGTGTGTGAGVGVFSFSFMKECCIRVRGLG